MNLSHTFLLKRLFGVAQIHGMKLNYCTRPQQSFNPKEIKKSARFFFHKDKCQESAKIIYRGITFTVMKYFLEIGYLIKSKKALEELGMLAICSREDKDMRHLFGDWYDGIMFRHYPFFLDYEMEEKYLMENALRYINKFPLLDKEKVKEIIVKEFGQILDEKNVNENQKITVQKIEGYPQTTVAFCGKYYYPTHKFL